MVLGLELGWVPSQHALQPDGCVGSCINVVGRSGYGCIWGWVRHVLHLGCHTWRQCTNTRGANWLTILMPFGVMPHLTVQFRPDKSASTLGALIVFKLFFNVFLFLFFFLGGLLFGTDRGRCARDMYVNIASVFK